MPDASTKQRKIPKRVRNPLRHGGESASAIARAKGEPCGRCHTHHVLPNGKPSCNGHKRQVRPWQPCRKPPIRGGAVCARHGGDNPKVRARADLRLSWAAAEGEVADLMRACDIPKQHPIDGLLEVVRHSGAMMRLLGYMCAQLDEAPEEIRASYKDNGDVVRFTMGEPAIWGINHAGDATPNVLMTMYGQWADRYARACKLAMDANIDERLVRNAESTSDAVYRAVSKALDSADLSPQQSAAFSKSLALELRKLVGPIDEMKRA
jgi:hypothetical protein